MNANILTNKVIEFVSAILIAPHGNVCSELPFELMFNGTEPCWRPLIPPQTDYSITEEKTSGFISLIPYQFTFSLPLCQTEKVPAH